MLKRRAKKLPTRVCVYCGDAGHTRDHVPPKLLLESPLPSTLHTVWACSTCNQGLSTDEQYLLTIITHVSRAETLTQRIAPGGPVDRAFNYDQTLEDELLDMLQIDEQTGTVTLTPDLDRVGRVVSKIARGLCAIRFGRVPHLSQIGRASLYPYDIVDLRSTQDFISTYSERFQTKRWTVVQPAIFSYIFVRSYRHPGRLQCVMNIHDSLWAVVDLPTPNATRLVGPAQRWLFDELKEYR
jgi:hypothetical protein